MATYVVSFGYTYGAETWKKFGIKGFSTGTPNLDATKAAEGSSFGDLQGDDEVVKMFRARQKCGSKVACTESYEQKVDAYLYRLKHAD